MEENEDNGLDEMQEQGLEKKAIDAVKDGARNATKQATNKAKKAVRNFLIAHIGIIIAIITVLIVVVVIVGGIVVIYDGIVEIASNIEDAIMSFVKIDTNGPVIPSVREVIDLVDKQLEEMGIDKNELNMGNNNQREAYLYKYMATSISTKLPYIKNSTAKAFKEIARMFVGGVFDPTEKQEVQGIVKIKRKVKDEEEKKDLDFKKYEDFQKLIEENDTSALEYFSIDEDWMLCVATNKKVTTTINDGEPSVTNEITEVKIPYQTMLSKYSVPFEFFMTLQRITLNPEYVSAVADLIQEQGEIELTIFDSTEIITNEYTYKYKVKEKWMQEVKVEKESYDLENLPNEIPPVTSRSFERRKIARRRPNMIETEFGVSIDNGGTGSNAGTGNGSENNFDSETGNTTQPQQPEYETIMEPQTSTSEEQTETKITVTEINNVLAGITKADVWVIKQETGYEINEEPEPETVIENQLKNEDEPVGEKGTWKVDRSEKIVEKKEKAEWKPTSNKVEINESEFLGLWRNEKGKYEEGLPYVSEDDGGEKVYYKIPLSKVDENTLYPIDNILVGEDWLYTLLERRETTQAHAQIMRYLIHFYKTGEKLDISEVLSLFDVTLYDATGYTRRKLQWGRI